MHQGGELPNFNLPNLRYFLLNNGVHESVGGQKTIGLEVNFEKIFPVLALNLLDLQQPQLKTLYEIKKNDSSFIVKKLMRNHLVSYQDQKNFKGS